MASAFAKALPQATRTRALKYILGGTAGAVALGTGGTYTAYHYFVRFEETRRDEAARGGPIAPKPSNLADGPPAWPIVAAASTCFSVGALGGLAIGAGRRDPKKGAVHAEGAILGAKAFVIATAIVGAVGVGIVYTIRLGLGVSSIREFGELVRGGPMILDDGDGWDLADTRHDYINGRLRLDSGLEIMYDLLNYSGSLGSDQQAEELQQVKAAAAVPDGPQPVVLLHGLSGNRETMRELVAPGLVEAGHAVLLPDQRGASGGSTSTRAQRKVWWRWQPGTAGDAADSQGVGVSILAEDTIKLLDKLHLPAAHLVGCSIGGLIAEEIAIRHPKRVLSVTVAALDSNNAATTATTTTAGPNGGEKKHESFRDEFCPVDPKDAVHWAAARAAAAAAYSPPGRPSCPVTLVIPPRVAPASVLQLPYAYQHIQRSHRALHS